MLKEATTSNGDAIAQELYAKLIKHTYKPKHNFPGARELYDADLGLLKGILNQVIKVAVAQEILDGTLPDWALDVEAVEYKTKLEKMVEG